MNLGNCESLSFGHSKSDDVSETSIFFLGGLYGSDDEVKINELSKEPLQVAANALQFNLIRGIVENNLRISSIVNLPFVPSYPQAFASPSYRASGLEEFSEVNLVTPKFSTVRFYRYISRSIATFRSLISLIGKNNYSIVIVYSAHLPFVASAWVLKKLRRNVSVSVVVPDLPEFMGTGRLASRLLVMAETRIIGKLARSFDNCVLLTAATGERMGITKKNTVIIEGIFSPIDDTGVTDCISRLPIREKDTIVLLYSGTLSARYGIRDLLEAFASLKQAEARLWMCGDGDARSEVEAMALVDPRMKYFGQVPREVALSMQRRADILVNPRRPEGEFTKYSFPSKTMEYLAAGRPVVMHALPGVPLEYSDYLILTNTSDSAGLAEALELTLRMPDRERKACGDRGRKFILSRKSPKAQVARLIDMWKQQASERNLRN